MKLFMVLIGCKPQGRHTEQHDIFFGIAPSLSELVPQLNAFWPGNHRLHIDAWREVTAVNGFAVQVKSSPHAANSSKGPRLFFINLGGYKPMEFEEYHYKLILAAPNKAAAIRTSKASAFFKHTGYKGAEAHIDDQYGIDVDDSYQIEELLSENLLQQHSIELSPLLTEKEDTWHIGYTKLSSLVKK
jgi:hypothetical protein